jgi:hypothetical protein
LRIRKAHPLDKDKILNFCKDTFTWGDYIGIVWDFWLTDPSGILLVVDDLNSSALTYGPVATSHIGICPNDLLWIEGIRVDKNCRNRRIGTSLLQYAVNYGVKKGLCETCALVSYNNINSKKMFEGQGFAKNCVYGYYNIKIKKKFEFADKSLILRYAHYDDVRLICEYLNNSGVYLETNNRYFHEWRLYKLENTFDCICDLIEKKKLVLILDVNDVICGLSIINIIEYESTFYDKPLIQVCYLDCISNHISINSIFRIIEKFNGNNKHKNVQLFVTDDIDLNALSTTNNGVYNIETFERFIVYCKKLK